MIPKHTICPVPLARSGAALIFYQYTDYTAPVSMDVGASIQGQFRLSVTSHTPDGEFAITGSETEGSEREHIKQVFAAFFLIGDFLLSAVPVSAVLRVGGLNITSL